MAALLSPVARWLAAGAVVLALGLVILLQSARLDAAQLRARQAIDAANANAELVKRTQADQAHAAQLVASYAAEIATLQEQDRANRNAIIRAAQGRTTSACADSLPMRALLDSVRRERAAEAGHGRAPATR